METQKHKSVKRPVGAKHRHTHGKEPVKAPSNPFLRIFRACGLGVLGGALIGILLLVIGAYVVSGAEDPDRFLRPIALLALALSSLCCGFISVHFAEQSAFPVYVLSAILWLFVSFSVSLCLPAGIGGFSPIYSIALRILQLIFVLLGAFLGKNRPRRIKHRGRKG